MYDSALVQALSLSVEDVVIDFRLPESPKMVSEILDSPGNLFFKYFFKMSITVQFILLLFGSGPFCHIFECLAFKNKI